MPNCESVSLNDRPPRKSRIEHNWSGLAQRADLTADMLNRQQRATSRHQVETHSCLQRRSKIFVAERTAR